MIFLFVRFKTASITQFIDGTIIDSGKQTDTYRTIEANFYRDIKKSNSSETQQQVAVETNISAFTMPQTINNFNEPFIGHNENVIKKRHKDYKKNYGITPKSIHDKRCY